LGISTEKYTVEKGRVSRYQTFADLLTPHGVSYQKAVELAEAVRRIHHEDSVSSLFNSEE